MGGGSKNPSSGSIGFHGGANACLPYTFLWLPSLQTTRMAIHIMGIGIMMTIMILLRITNTQTNIFYGHENKNNMCTTLRKMLVILPNVITFPYIAHPLLVLN